MEPATPDPSQLSFAFDAESALLADDPPPENAKTKSAENEDPAEHGLNAWRDERMEHIRKLAARAGLPLEHQVELTLRSGPVLRGQLRLAVDSLWVETEHLEQILFEVDGATFRVREIESCVRTD